MLSAELARYISNLKYSDLPGEVVNAARVAVMDWLGSVLAGSTEKPAHMTAQVLLKAGGHPRSSMIGFDVKSSALNAALINGVSCHILELDDLHRSSILHPAAPIISAAAAAAEDQDLNGKALITALVAGFEVGIRIAEAVTPSHYRYWHTTATCGTFGAAAAAAKVYNLSEDKIIDALGNAGSQAAGLWEFLADGAMTKHLHPGKAAMNGLLAVQLADNGFTGASKILEGEKGFFRAMASEYKVERVTKGLGKEFRILGNSYKIYPSCRHTHSGVDLAIKLFADGLDPEQVEQVKARTYRDAFELVGGADYNTPFKAKFSLPYCISRALIDGKLNLDSFDFTKPMPGQLKGLVNRCRVVVDPELENLYPGRWAAALDILLKDGTEISERTEFPRGDPENPASPEELKEKFIYLAGRRWPEKRVSQTLVSLERLERLDRVETLFNYCLADSI